MFALVVVGFVLAAIIAPALALHHRRIHKDMPPADGIPELCFLQPSDVCATHCTHENWILAALILAVVFITAGTLVAH